MNKQLLQRSTILDLLYIRVSTNMFLFDEDVGNGSLTGLLSEVSLNFVSIVNLIQLVYLEWSAEFSESLFCLTTIWTPTYMISTAHQRNRVQGDYSLSRRRPGSRQFVFLRCSLLQTFLMMMWLDIWTLRFFVMFREVTCPWCGWAHAEEGYYIHCVVC